MFIYVNYLCFVLILAQNHHSKSFQHALCHTKLLVKTYARHRVLWIVDIMTLKTMPKYFGMIYGGVEKM